MKEIKLTENQSDLLTDLQGDKDTMEIAYEFDYGLAADEYAVLGIAYSNTTSKHLKERICDFLTEINYHTGRAKLESGKGDLYDYFKSF